MPDVSTWGGSGMLVVVFCLSILGCTRHSASQAAQEAVRDATAPAQASWNVHFAVYQEGRHRAVIEAAYMAHYEREDTSYTLLHSFPDSLGGRVTAHVFDEQGDSSAVITANRMVYYDTEDRFEARGRVVVNTVEDKHLESEHLVWYEEKRQIRTPGFVRIITPTDHVQGYGLVAAEDLSTYHLSNVTGETTVEDL